jgi:FkbM family methyltransferase
MLRALKRAARPSVIQLLGRGLDRLGHVHVPKWQLGSYPLAQHLTALFEAYGIDCVFDIGANTGQYGSFLREQVGYRGAIVSVEPVAGHAESLRATATGDRNWTVRQVALGAEPGRLAMNVARRGDFSSFLAPDDSRVRTFATENETVRIEEVEVTTFDALLASVRDEGIPAGNLYLKLDTQGYDLQVLEGARWSLAGVLALQTEMSVQPIYKGMPDYRTALDRLDALGFAPSGMFPVTHDARMRLVELDCVMVRRDAPV